MKTFSKVSSKISFTHTVSNLFPDSFNTTGNYLGCLMSFYCFSTKIVQNMFAQKNNLTPSGFGANNKHIMYFFVVLDMHCRGRRNTLSLVWSTFVISIWYFILLFFFTPSFLSLQVLLWSLARCWNTHKKPGFFKISFPSFLNFFHLYLSDPCCWTPVPSKLQHRGVQ